MGWRTRAAAVVVLIAALAAAAASAPPAERITRFASAIRIAPDAGLRVEETIRVASRGERIQRGIYRDFPTRYTDRAGNRFTVGFRIESVARNGSPEPFHTEARANGIRVYIGRKDLRLPPGEHTYTLTYTTERQLGFFERHDELYWNVTGNGWEFQIDAAEALVVPPPGVPAEALALEAYTGPAGAQGRDFSARVTAAGHALFTTTRALAPGEGLTLVLGWPKGFVAEPTLAAKSAHLLRDNLTLLVAAAGILFLLGYYLLVWAAVGKDPARGVIMPIYTPPDNLSPAAMRFIAQMGYDHRVFAAAVIDMAVKGALAIEEKGGTTTLRRKEGGPVALSAEEQKIAAHLFRSAKALALERSRHAAVAAAVNALRTSLAFTFEKTHFVTNRRAFFTGAAVSAAVVAAAFLSALDQAEAVFLGIWLTGWSIGVVFLAVMVAKLWGQVFTGMRHLNSWVGSLGAALFMSAFALPFFGAEVFALVMLARESPGLAALLATVVLANVLFYHLLKAPTLLGRRLLDRIEGFKMFLAATEADRLQRMLPAARTPELFERFLPYALALGVEQQWAEQFAGELAAARPGGDGYQPAWYSGAGWNPSRIGAFTTSLGASLTGAISSSATAPGSRSGGGGGGSSGGGGGGGGGGGW
ncbi:MAG: DUF2207 domain-containing protein [Desulfobacterales bacterium]|jgi:uncharacterized membrane protein YgcG|nr:DUF2207 domain-containing protein [Desulfobacterales bacterium]